MVRDNAQRADRRAKARGFAVGRREHPARVSSRGRCALRVLVN